MPPLNLPLPISPCGVTLFDVERDTAEARYDARHGERTAARGGRSGVGGLEAGGNAVDAAVATALVQTAVDPQMCGIAGFGTFHVYLPAIRVHTTLDFHGRSPLAVRPDMWEHLILHEADDGWGFILEGRVNEQGYGAITTPRTLAALDEALRRWGTRPLRDLLPPAIEYCEDGFPCAPTCGRSGTRPLRLAAIPISAS